MVPDHMLLRFIKLKIVFDRLIAAKKNSKGEAVDIVLYSSCVDKKESYDGSSDTCS